MADKANLLWHGSLQGLKKARFGCDSAVLWIAGSLDPLRASTFWNALQSEEFVRRATEEAWTLACGDCWKRGPWSNLGEAWPLEAAG